LKESQGPFGCVLHELLRVISSSTCTHNVLLESPLKQHDILPLTQNTADQKHSTRCVNVCE